MTEAEVFALISEAISIKQKQKFKPLRVAVNGIEGTGKTVFTNKLTQYLAAQNKNAFHVSIDGFHKNREARYRQGRNSAKGYYEDSYDETAFVEKVLLSSQALHPHYIPAIHDLETDAYITTAPVFINDDAIILTDGAYLFKPNYRQHWDLKIYLKTDFQTALTRGANRDAEHLGGITAAEEKFAQRYHQASKIYILENKPEQLADIVIDNTEFDDLKVIRSV